MKFARKRDFILVGAVAAAGLLLWVLLGGAAGKPGAYAEIYLKQRLVKTVALTRGKEESFFLPELPGVVFHLYEDGSIAFFSSDCPDQICVLAGKLRFAGRTAACLPNEVYIKIVAEKLDPDAPDVVIG